MKRGSSGLSLMLAVNKPSGISSHDAVNHCRKVFQERRVGHMGTLDPLATGILPLCIGPATRLNPYISEQGKTYVTRIVFGHATDTDDSCGKLIESLAVSPLLYNASFAQATLQSFLGPQLQIPPRYSAIKVQGKKAYVAARAHEDLVLEPRPIMVFDLHLLSIESVPSPFEDALLPAWTVEFCVSKGTYIRSLARDLGKAVSSCAYLDYLCRTTLGSLTLDDCVSLEALADVKEHAAIDPLDLIACRFAFLSEKQAARVRQGNEVCPSDLMLFTKAKRSVRNASCLCIPQSIPSDDLPESEELIALLFENTLIALYSFDERKQVFKAKCVFPIGVSRGDHH